MAATVAVILPSATLLAPTTAHALPPCDNHFFDRMGRYHNAGDGVVSAIRAPIQLRKNSNLCGTPDTQSIQTSNWISLEDDDADDTAIGDFGQIRQIGWEHWPYMNPGNVGYCAFSAVGIGQPHVFDCGEADSTFTWFQVIRDNNYHGLGTQKMVTYSCGHSGGYAVCTERDADYVPAHTRATTTVETNWPCSATGTDVLEGGSSPNRVNYGTTSYPIQIKNNAGDSWASTIQLEGDLPDLAGCAHYHRAYTYNGVGANAWATWDDRNTA